MPTLLSIELADGTTEHISIADSGPITIGRDATCHVVLPSPDVSRRHVTIESVPEGIKVTDSSANGTFIGKKRLLNKSVILSADVPFRVGGYTIRLRQPEPLGAARGHATTTNQPALTQSGEGPTLGPAPNANARARTMPPDMGGVSGYPQANARGAPMPIPSRPQREPLRELPQSGAVPLGQGGPAAIPAGEPVWRLPSGTSKVPVEVRRRIHRMLLDQLDLITLERSKMDEKVMRPKVREALTRIMKQIERDLPQGTDINRLIEEMGDEALGLGPLEMLLADESVTEVMVVDPQTIFVERGGKIEHTDLRFTDDEAVRAVIERIVTPLGRRIDESTPLVDARLKDGSRVNSIIKPLAIRGACITIRKFAKKALSIDDLVKLGGFTAQMAKFLQRSVISRKNVVISGGTGSGKTTLLNILAGAIPVEERVVTIEDAAELRLPQPHVVSLESRPANMEGKGEITIRDLVRNALRMRPDRIVVGECRGGEALDMLQAMNTGHDGSMTTTHANSPREALARLETLALMSGVDLPSRAIREQIANSVHIILQQARFGDGSRRVTAISEVVGLDENGEIEVQEIFRFERTGTGEKGRVIGEFRATGYLPSFLDEFIKRGLVQDGDFV